MSSSVLKLMDDVTAPMSLVNTLLQKPAIIARLIYHAVPWKIKASPAKTHPSVVAFLQALRTSEPPSELTGLEGDLKIGVAGFCWGGKHAFMLAADAQESRVVRFGAGEGKMEKERLVDAIFTAHPSYIDVPGDCETVKIPLSVAIGDQDMAMKEPLVRQMKALLEAKNGEGEGEKEYVVEILEGAKHGFAVRTHPEDKREMECAEIAESQAIKWFERWLGSS
jgi:dienelactone hydrolase